MKTILGICGKCNYEYKYTEEDVRKPWYTRCARGGCGAAAVWRVYTSEELDKIMRGEKVM